MTLLLLPLLAVLAPAEPTPERGREVYAAQRCTLCHSVAGKGNPKGPHDGIGSKLDGETIRQWLLDAPKMAAKANATRKPPMPSFAHLSREEQDALIAYLLTLKKTDAEASPKP